MTITRDPVCGERIDSTSAAARQVYAGQTYYFCSIACKERFTASPETYAFKHPGPE